MRGGLTVKKGRCGREDLLFQVYKEAVGKRPSAALPSSLVTAAYFYVRLIPPDFGSLTSGHFPSASQQSGFQQSRKDSL
jgi:hypothetical protein